MDLIESLIGFFDFGYGLVIVGCSFVLAGESGARQGGELQLLRLRLRYRHRTGSGGFPVPACEPRCSNGGQQVLLLRTWPQARRRQGVGRHPLYRLLVLAPFLLPPLPISLSF